MNAYFKLMRLKQWLKNIFVIFPLLFGNNLASKEGLLMAVILFLIFSINASAVYALNDALDVEKDREHPKKCKRAVASGAISPTAAVAFSLLLFSAAFISASLINLKLLYILAIYGGMNIFYSLLLKRIVILDVMIIALGFIWRIAFGSVMASGYPSQWILLTTFFLALFLALIKRRSEILKLDSSASRAVLKEYSPQMVDQLLAALMGITILTYGLYAISSETVHRFDGEYMGLTIPFVVFGIFRYYQQTHLKNSGESPADVLLKDKPILVNICLWLITCLVIVYL